MLRQTHLAPTQAQADAIEWLEDMHEEVNACIHFDDTNETLTELINERVRIEWAIEQVTAFTDQRTLDLLAFVNPDQEWANGDPMDAHYGFPMKG